MKKNNDTALLILRITIGLLMLLHGFGKLTGGLDFIKGMLSEMGIPAFVAYGVIVGEVIAPIAIIVGFRTRIASAFFAMNALVAILMVHSSDIFKMGEHGGWAIELLGLYLFGAIALVFSGSGKYALSNSNKWD